MDSIDWTRFSKATLEGLDPEARASVCNELAQLLQDHVEPEPEFHASVTRLIAALRHVGHDLWSFDGDDDYAAWCPDWRNPSGPGLVITFSSGEVEVSWSKESPG